MTDEAEQERLLAEALRAQAVRAPVPDPARPEPRLLSGQDVISGREPDAQAPRTVGLRPGLAPGLAPGTTRIPRTTGQAPPLSVWWIVLLAVLLGLAAGAVVGLVSIL